MRARASSVRRKDWNRFSLSCSRVKVLESLISGESNAGTPDFLLAFPPTPVFVTIPAAVSHPQRHPHATATNRSRMMLHTPNTLGEQRICLAPAMLDFEVPAVQRYRREDYVETPQGTKFAHAAGLFGAANITLVSVSERKRAILRGTHRQTPDKRSYRHE
jgi:hypothetical protein